MNAAKLCPSDRDFPVFNFRKEGFSVACETCGTETHSLPSLPAAIAAWNNNEVTSDANVDVHATA